MTARYNVKMSAFIVIVGILISRILGFVREMLTANIFGMGLETDAFYAAFTIPDVMYNMLIGGTMSAAFIPVFTSYLAVDKEEQGWKVASNFINIILITLLSLTIVGMIFTPYIVPLVAYNFAGEQLVLAIKLTRIMFSAVAFTCLAGLGIGILHSYQKFLVAVLGPIVYNIGVILSLLIYKIFNLDVGIELIAYGVVISAIANFALQFLALSKKVKFYKFFINIKDNELKKILKLAIPSIVGLSIIQLNYIITQNFASGLPEGSITAFKYSNIVMSLPVGIFAMGIATAVFPTLTRQITLDKINEYKETFSLALRTVFFITIPSAVGLAVLSEPIIRLLFESGQFTEDKVKITGFALLIFSLAITFQGGMQLFMRGFYSINDTITPVKVGVVTVITNVVLNILFLKYLALKYPIGSLVLAMSVAMAVNMILLAVIFNKKINGINIRRILKSVIKTVTSSFVMGMVIYYLLNTLSFSVENKLGQIYQVGSLITIGVLVFGISVLMLKMEEGQYFISLITSKIKSSLNKS